MSSLWSWRKFAAGLMLVGAVGCTKSCGKGHGALAPDQVVEAYLNVAMNMSEVAQRAELLEYTTGNLHEAIAAASDQVIQQAYISKRYKLENYSLIERRDRTPRETEVTFQIKYKDLTSVPGGSSENAVTVTTENTVRVIREKESWLISDVTGNKTSVEFPVLKDMEIKAAPAP